MARDISSVFDAIDRAKGINSGLDALVALMLGCNESDVPQGKILAELLWSIQRDMETVLNEASRSLKR